MNNNNTNILCTMIIISVALLVYMALFLDETMYIKEGYIILSVVSFICWVVADYNIKRTNCNLSEVLKTFISLSYVYILYEVTFSDYPRNIAIFIGLVYFILFSLVSILLRAIRTK